MERQVMFPDSDYDLLLAYGYNEPYVGTYFVHRIEFKVIRTAPVSLTPIRKAIEAKSKLLGRHLIGIKLYRGPNIDVPYFIDSRAYKIEVYEHGSPAVAALIPAIIWALSALLAAYAFAVLATKTDTRVLERAGEGLGEIGKGVGKLPVAAIFLSIAYVVSVGRKR